MSRPFGSWPTPVTADVVLADAVRLTDVQVDGPAGAQDVYWSEGRPAEGGRVQIVRRTLDGAGATGLEEVLPAGFSARTAVHEYGGGAWWVRGGVVWFAAWSDQRLHRLDPPGPDGRRPAPVPLTPAPEVERGDRYADGDVSPDGTTLVVVRERHTATGRADEVRNELVLLDAARPGEPRVVVSGPDFVAAPRFSPDGARLAYLRWNHPAMPWDATELVVRHLGTGEETVVAGGPAESVAEPRWQALPDGARLLFLSDRSDLWNLYAWRPGRPVEAVLVTDGEIGVPAWVFGQARYAPLPDGAVAAAVRRRGADELVVLDARGRTSPVDVPLSEIAALRATGDGLVVLGGSATSEPAVHRVGLPEGSVRRLSAVRDLAALGIGPEHLSVPRWMSFASGPDAARTAHALFYPPAHPTEVGPEGGRPPLLVMIHGGPTAAASGVLNLAVQFWTSRGFAVADVDYGGSTGYGRAYRELLRGQWGVVDVEDCLAVARRLAEQGLVDGERLCIRGGSAGGFTTLAALARPDTPFAAGADHFGVANLEALAADTHKFESRYLDGLVGPYPAAQDRYRELSPLSHVADFHRPLIVLQGAEDPIVPPNQSEAIVDALRAREVPVAYLLFEGEQHGFRRADNIRRALHAELSFYAQVLGFPLPADEEIEPVEVEFLPDLGPDPGPDPGPDSDGDPDPDPA